MLPTFLLSISVDSSCLNSASTSFIIDSTWSKVAVVFSVDFKIPLVSFSRSNRSLLPFLFIIMMGNCSTLSYVVNRFKHLAHSLLLLTAPPSSDVLVSTTSVSLFPQKIQCINSFHVMGNAYHQLFILLHLFSFVWRVSCCLLHHIFGVQVKCNTLSLNCQDVRLSLNYINIFFTHKRKQTLTNLFVDDRHFQINWTKKIFYYQAKGQQATDQFELFFPKTTFSTAHCWHR